MKKMALLGIILSLVLVIFIGCPDDPETDPVDTRDRMTFVDDFANTGREFIIYEDLSFRVELFAPYFEPCDCGDGCEGDDADEIVCEGCDCGRFKQDALEDLKNIFIVPGLRVQGKIYNTSDTWLNDTITGTAGEMSANDPDLTLLFEMVGVEVGIETSYARDADSNITEISVEFTSGDYVEMSEILMRGSYIRKE